MQKYNKPEETFQVCIFFLHHIVSVLLLKYPLKEVVVIHQDAEALKDIQSLQKYILEVRWTYCIGVAISTQSKTPFCC